MIVLNDYTRTIIIRAYGENEPFDKYHLTTKHKTKPIVLMLLFWYFPITEINNNLIMRYADDYEFIILANTIEEYELYKHSPFECIFINHNCFINEDVFNIDPSKEKKYDMAVNSAFQAYKRIPLTKLVNNIVYISRKCDEINNDSVSPDSFNSNSHFANFKDNIIKHTNYASFTHNQVNSILNESLMGGIFSKVEGACFSSSQYLLCGLPVISTKCKGGREIWYNEDNMVYCEDNEESVKNCVEIIKNKLKDGSFDRHKIREDHIKLQDKFRSELKTFIIKKLDLEPTNIEAMNKLLRTQWKWGINFI